MSVETRAGNSGKSGPYEAFVAEYYDYLLPVSGRQDIEFFCRKADQQGGPILELGCGTGRVLLALARAGHRIAGLDLSAAMLNQCRKKLQSESPGVRERVRLILGDMAEFDAGEKFQLILIPFRPFQHLLSVEQQMGCLSCVRRHLAPQGQLILDVFHTDPRRMSDPAFLEESSPYPEVALPDGRRLRLSERIAGFHRAEQINDVEMFYNITHPDGRRERLVFAFRLRYFFRYEIEHLLARCGFVVKELFGNYDGQPLEADSPEMVFVSQVQT